MHVHNLFKAIQTMGKFSKFFEIFVISIFKQQTVHNKNNNKKKLLSHRLFLCHYSCVHWKSDTIISNRPLVKIERETNEKDEEEEATRKRKKKDLPSSLHAFNKVLFLS